MGSVEDNTQISTDDKESTDKKRVQSKKTRLKYFF